MAPSESFDCWIIWAKHLANSLPPEAIAESRQKAFRLAAPESLFGQANLELGILPPLSGSFRNPLALSAVIWPRTMFWGLVLPPHLAARYAYWDAVCDQATDQGVVSATLASCLNATGPVDWLRRMLGLIERVPAARAMLRHVTDGVTSGMAPEALAKTLPGVAGTSDPYDMVLNLGHLALAILEGRGEFGATVCLAAALGGASDAVGSYAGALSASWSGVPDDWTEPLGNSYVSSGILGDQELPATLGAFVNLVGEAGGQSLVQSVQTAPTIQTIEDASTGYLAGLEEQPPSPPPTTSANLPVDIPATNSSSSVQVVGDVLVNITYEDLPVAQRDSTIQCVVTFENRGEAQILDPKVASPDQWLVAHRLTSFRLLPHTKQSFPLVLQPTTDGGQASLSLSGVDLPVVAIQPQSWYVCGPMANYDGQGFEKTFKCEDIWHTSEVFAGRGDQGVKWRERQFAGVVIDVEPYFTQGPGVICLAATFEFAKLGSYHLVVAGSPGIVVKVNQRTVIKYQHSHRPVPRPMLPYLAQFEVTGPVDILIKLVRNLEPTEPLSVYFIGPDGHLAFPTRMIPMPT